MDCGPTTATLHLTFAFNVMTPTNRSLDVQTNDSTMQLELSGLSAVKPWPLLKQPLCAVLLLATCYVVVAVVGIVSNSVVVAVICQQARMRTVINYFLANLAVADILVCVVVLPITLLQNSFTGMTSSIYSAVGTVGYPLWLGSVATHDREVARVQLPSVALSGDDSGQIFTHLSLSLSIMNW